MAFLLSFAIANVGTAQTRPAPGRSTVVIAAGATLGLATGALAGALAGGNYTSRNCPTGDPDQCLGQAFPGFIWGAGAGGTLGAPLGAYFTDRRQGSLPRSLLVSGAIFAVEVLALRSLIDDGRTEHLGAVRGIVITAPLLQILSSTLIEVRSRKHVAP